MFMGKVLVGVIFYGPVRMNVKKINIVNKC